MLKTTKSKLDYMVDAIWSGLVAAWCPVFTGYTGSKLVDLSGRGAHGTLTSMDPYTDWLPGSSFGPVLDFDGTNDYIDFTAPYTLPVQVSPISIFARVKLTATQNTRNIVCAANGGTITGFGFGIDDTNNNKLKWFTATSGGSSNTLTGSTALTNNVWATIGAVYAGAQASPNKMTYLDGKLDNSTTWAAELGYSAGVPFSLGRYPGGASQFFQGQIAEVLVARAVWPVEFFRMLTAMPPGFIFRPRKRRTNRLDFSVFKSVSDTATGTDDVVSGLLKTVSDSGTVSETVSFTVTVSIADAGAGVDTPNKSFSINETGSGVDALFITYNNPIITETGSGTDAVSVAVYLAMAETGSGVDALPAPGATPYYPIDDTGAGVDAVSRTALTTAIAETAVGTDTPAVSAQATIADTTSGADAVAVSANPTQADTGTGVDAVAVANLITLSEPGTGIGQDLISITVSLSLADTVSGVDALTVDPKTSPIAETATGVDAAPSIGVVLPLADTGAFVDALFIAVSLSIVEVGSATDASGPPTASFGLADLASVADLASISVSVNLSDVGSGTDSADVAPGRLVNDIGAGSDTVAIGSYLVIADLAAGSDPAPQPSVALPALADTASGLDAILSPFVALSLPEVGSGADAIVAPAVSLPSQETGYGADALTVAVLVSVADTATGADVFAVDKTIPPSVHIVFSPRVAPFIDWQPIKAPAISFLDLKRPYMTFGNPIYDPE